jgi:hypothetical protein
MPRRKRNKKWIFKLLFFILLVVACLVIYFVWDGYFRDKGDQETRGSDNDYAQVEEKNDEGNTKNDDAEQKESENEVDPAYEEKAIQYDGESPNESDVLTGAISYSSVNGNNYSIRVSIDQYLEEGVCELVLVQGGGVVYQETVDIMGDATTSTCKGFDVPMANLSSGEVQFTVYFSSGDRVGEVSGGMEI